MFLYFYNNEKLFLYLVPDPVSVIMLIYNY